MIRKNFIKKVAVLCSAATILVGTVSVSATSGSATINSGQTKVTVTYSDCYGSTICYLKGQEYNPSNGNTFSYNKQVSTTKTGKEIFKFSSTNGRWFVLSGLKSLIYINGNKTAEMTVS